MEKLIKFDFIFFVDEKAFANWIFHPCTLKCKLSTEGFDMKLKSVPEPSSAFTQSSSSP